MPRMVAPMRTISARKRESRSDSSRAERAQRRSTYTGSVVMRARTEGEMAVDDAVGAPASSSHANSPAVRTRISRDAPSSSSHQWSTSLSTQGEAADSGLASSTR